MSLGRIEFHSKLVFNLLSLLRRYTTIEFSLIHINLMLPPTLQCKNAAIRGMWQKYDHFSDFCPSFVLKSKQQPNLGEAFVEGLSGKGSRGRVFHEGFLMNNHNILADISIAARKEWKKRKELMKIALDNVDQTDDSGAVPYAFAWQFAKISFEKMFT